MTSNVVQAAALLGGARRNGTRVRLPPELAPRSASDAYAIQDAIGAALSPGGAPIRGWKVGAPDAHTEPSAAPIYQVLPGPARIAAAKLAMIGVETEIAALFERALPPRDTPYGTAEVFGAVGELRVAIEICDSRLENWSCASDYAKLADHQLNFALVLGDAISPFDSIDFRAIAVRTIVNGTTLKAGVGCHAVGNPLQLLPWLANHARLRGGLHAGTAVTTGAWLVMHLVEPGTTVVAEFQTLGRAQVEFFV